MNDNDEACKEKKLNKARSCLGGSPRLKKDAPKRKSFLSNEAVRTLDLALGRLKKSKLVGDIGTTESSASPLQGFTAMDMFMDYRSTCPATQGVDCPSVLSMNFSHYELMRNLSRSNCNSDGANSGATESDRNPMDTVVKGEHLEKYFRSAEMWKNYRGSGGSSTLQLDSVRTPPDH